jgi:GNAT superfamily N-acetyltransferase
MEENQIRGIAELRSLQVVWSNEAEAAFSVERSWRGRGIGTALMAEAIRTASRLSVEHIYMSCDTRNRAMQRVAGKFLADIHFQDFDCFVHLTVPRSSMDSHLNRQVNGDFSRADLAETH